MPVPCHLKDLFSCHLSLKIKPDRTQALKLYYEDEMLRAITESGSEASTYITPKAYYPSVT